MCLLLDHVVVILKYLAKCSKPLVWIRTAVFSTLCVTFLGTKQAFASPCWVHVTVNGPTVTKCAVSVTKRDVMNLKFQLIHVRWWKETYRFRKVYIHNDTGKYYTSTLNFSIVKVNDLLKIIPLRKGCFTLV